MQMFCIVLAPVLPGSPTNQNTARLYVAEDTHTHTHTHRQRWERKTSKNDFNLASIFSPIVVCKVVLLYMRNKENPITSFLFFTSSVAFDGLSNSCSYHFICSLHKKR